MATVLSFSAINILYKGSNNVISGTSGMAPAPSVGQQNYFLKGNGDWATGSYAYMNIVVFTSSGTYTPGANVKYLVVECLGAGGSGGSVDLNSDTAGPTIGAGGGGGAGQYAKSVITNLAASYSVTVPQGADSSATQGGDSIFGNNLVVAKGGISAASMVASTNISFLVASSGAGGGTAGGGVGDLLINGQPGRAGMVLSAGALLGGGGGDSVLAFGGQDNVDTADGYDGQGYGAGGSGACYYSATENSLDKTNGGAGGNGVCIITEYIITS